MHMFLITRMFSGLFESIEQKIWAPTGIPTVTKLVEKLSRKNGLTWVISCKTKKESAIVNHQFRRIKLNNVDIHIIPLRQTTKNDRINLLLNNIRTIMYCLKLARSCENAMFYFDRMHIIAAAAIKKMAKAYVVVRILGLYPDQKSLVLDARSKIKKLPTLWAYRVKYDFAICTQDGSGSEFYLDRLLHKKTPKTHLINGSNPTETCWGKQPNEPLSFLYVGKLEKEKGIMELIDAVTELRKKYQNFKLRVIGKGILKRQIENIVKTRQLSEFVEFVGSVSHSEIHQYYATSDVYISANKLGNLSNTVLEAMSAGKCIVMLGKDSLTHTDESTERLIPHDVVLRVGRSDIVGNLVSVLGGLCGNPEQIKKYSDKMVEFSKEFLWSWNERIDHEINLLDRITGGGLVLRGVLNPEKYKEKRSI
jgi:glycosyltransferase involved in cell wall biosynthesis